MTVSAVILYSLHSYSSAWYDPPKARLYNPTVKPDLKNERSWEINPMEQAAPNLSLLDVLILPWGFLFLCFFSFLSFFPHMFLKMSCNGTIEPGPLSLFPTWSHKTPVSACHEWAPPPAQSPLTCSNTYPTGFALLSASFALSPFPQEQGEDSKIPSWTENLPPSTPSQSYTPFLFL